jgi:hypothetical protein
MEGGGLGGFLRRGWAASRPRRPNLVCLEYPKILQATPWIPYVGLKGTIGFSNPLTPLHLGLQGARAPPP